MSVYVIGQITIHDRARYDQYVSRFLPVLEKYGGKLLAADERPALVFGAWDYQKVILLEFSDTKSFDRWASSTDYREIASDRIAATEGVILLVRGLGGASKD